MRRTCNRDVAGSTRVPAAQLHVTTLGKLFTHNMPLFTKQYKLVPAIGLEGNRRSDVALAMRHRVGLRRLSGISTYGLNGLRSTNYYGIFTFTFILRGRGHNNIVLEF